ncbi:hypothetical protein BCR33DRAFT_656020, partial [Rhizoclosmatium globosum]
ITCSLSNACSSLPPFSSRAAYKDHCRSIHHNPCSICKRILPSKHLLDLHLKELHDSFFSVLAERENSYECFVEGCVRKCSGPFKRKLHLMDAHQFPHSFDFHVILGYVFVGFCRYQRFAKKRGITFQTKVVKLHRRI